MVLLNAWVLIMHSSMSWFLTPFKCVLYTLNNLFLVLSRSLNYLLQPTLPSYLFAKSKEFYHFKILAKSGINALYITNIFCNCGKCSNNKERATLFQCCFYSVCPWVKFNYVLIFLLLMSCAFMGMKYSFDFLVYWSNEEVAWQHCLFSFLI